MSIKSVYAVREDKIKVEGKAWDHDDLRMLAAKKILQFQSCHDYWKYLLERGEDLWNKYNGKILTPEQRAYYEDVEDKIVLEPPIMKSPIRALVGQTMKARRSGQITTEDGSIGDPVEDVLETDTINVVMKDMEIKSKEEYLIRDAIHDSFVSCFWNAILFDKDRPSRNNNGMKYKVNKLPWRSLLVGPSTVCAPDGSDIKEMFFYDFRTMADLQDNFPDVAEQLEAHFGDRDFKDSKMFSSISQWDGSDSSEFKDSLMSIMDNAYGSKNGSSGLVPVVMHLFPIKRKEEVYVNIFDDTGEDFEIRPPEWSDERWNKWVEENKDKYHGPYEREAITLWITVFTTSGMILENKAHWFQENGRLPASFWLGAVTGEVPTGPAVDMADDCLANCISEIEYLDDLRKGSGTLILAREGAIKNMENLTEEANKSLGVGIVSKDYQGPVSDAVHEIKRTPNDHWKTYAEQRKAGMNENTRLNETMQGAAAPRQAAIAKEVEIAQALVVNAIYLDNINRCWESHQNLKLQMIPYFYDEYDVLEVRDDKTGDPLKVEVNVPSEYDAEGNPSGVINDLTAHKYRWKINPVDDSATAKLRNAEEALMVINGAAGPLLQKDPTGKLFAKFLMAFPNPFLNEAGKEMIQDADSVSQAQSQAEQQKVMREAAVELAKAKADLLRAEKQGVMLNFRAEDLNNFPALFKLYSQLQQMFNMSAEAKMRGIQQQVAPPQQNPMLMQGIAG